MCGRDGRRPIAAVCVPATPPQHSFRILQIIKMDKLLLVSAVVSSALGASAHSSLALSAADLAAPVHDVAAVEAHNAGEATWTAALQPKFEGWTMGEAVHLMGTCVWRGGCECIDWSIDW